LLLGALLFGQSLFAAPGDVLFSDDFESGLGQWTINTAGGGVAEINSATANSGNFSLALYANTVSATSATIAANVPEAELALWIRRGSDAFSENPETNEDLILQYRDNLGNWNFLETFPGGGTAGEISTRTYSLPSNALHANFQVRLTLRQGSGVPFDYWHIDDVVVTETGITSGPVADWRFDELSWTGTAGEVVDSSGNGYNGVSVNSAPTSGFLCNAADLSATGINDYVMLNAAALDGLGDFTISAWITSSRTGIQTVLSAAQSSTELNEAVFMFNSNTQFWPNLRQTPFDTSTQFNTAVNIADGNWHHAVWIRQRVTSQSCLYLDGNLQGCTTHPNGSNFLDVIAGGLLIGQEQDTIEGGFDATQAWDGLIDELLVFNSALSAGSVSTIYNNQLAGNNWDGSARVCPTPIPNPIAEWQMEQSGWTGAANEVIDSSGNNLHLTAFNSPLNLNLFPAISGDPGTCYYGDFNGTNSYLQIADNPLLDLSNALTITAWIYPRSLPASGLMSILSKDENYEFHLTPGGEINWWWGGGAQSLTTSGANILPNNWYHVAITFTSGEQHIYVNGTSMGSTNWTGSLTLNNDPLQIGQDQNLAGRFFNGAIDEVRIYDAALTEANINTIMAETHPCSAGGICDVVFNDGLDTVSYSGGSANWSGNWIEGNDNGTPASGNVAVVNNAIRFSNSPNVSIVRELDLSNALTATFNVDVSTANLDGNDRFQFIVSNNGGLTYTVLEQQQNDFNGSKSYDISAYMSVNTRIGFRVIQGFNQTNEFAAFDNIEVAITEPCDNNVILLAHDGNAINCYREAIQITIQNTSGVVQTDYTGTIQLSTSSANGVWYTVDDTGASTDLATGTLTNSGALDGNASYSFNTSDNGTVTLYLRDTVAETINIAATDGSAVDDDSEGLLTFRPFGFVLSPNPMTTQVAGKPFTATLTAAGQTPSDASCGVIEEYTGSKNLNFWSEFSQPAASATAMSIDGIPIAFSEAASTAQAVQFTAGVATITAQLNDVGLVSISAKDDVGIGDPVTGTTSEVIGGLAPFVVRPFAYHLAINGEPNANNDPNALVYATAGATFTTELYSVIWQAEDDANDDGIPDAFDNLANNPTTPNIGNLPSSGVDISFTPTAQVVANSSGVLGDASLSFNEFNATGVAPVPQSWSEVGILTISAATTNFLSGGESVAGLRENIGRFIPNSFALTLANNFDQQCGTFSYSGLNLASGMTTLSQTDDMTLQAQALNLSGGQTRNYNGAFVKLGAGNISITGVDNDSGNPALGTLYNGVISTPNFDTFGFADAISVPAVGFQFSNYATPFNLAVGLTATDSDGVVGNITSSAVEQRLGRAVIHTTYGPETESLEMPLSIEYFDGSNWTVNQQDNCSTYQSSELSFVVGSYQGDLDSGETLVLLPGAATSVNNGQSQTGTGFWLSAPGFGNSGEVNLTFDLAAQPWLQFDWDADATPDNPFATAGFGRYRGSDRVIYWRER